MGKPAARVGDMHTCPVPGSPPHGGGSIMPPGCPQVLIGGQPAAVMGDLATCIGPPDTLIMGSTSVFIGGKPAVRQTDTTAHGGTIAAGCPSVLIGDAASTNLSSAIKVTNDPKEKSEHKLMNLKWSRATAQRGDKIGLSAAAIGFSDGTPIVFQIFEYSKKQPHLVVDSFSNYINGGNVNVEWIVKYSKNFAYIETAGATGGKYEKPQYYFKSFVGELIEESNRIDIEDWIEIELIDENEKVAGLNYILYLPDGSEKRGKLDKDGYAREENIPPGPCKIEFPDLKQE